MLDPDTPLVNPPRGSFLANVNIVLTTYVLDGAFAFASGVLVARALGPDGRGAFGLFLVSTALAQMILGLGFGNAAIYYINRREMTVRDVVSAAHVVSIASLAISAAVVAVLVVLGGRDLLGDNIAPWLLVAAVPALIYSSALRVMFQATSRFIEMGVATIVQPVVMLGLFAAVYAAGGATPSRAVAIWAISNAAAALVSLSRLGLSSVDLGQIVRPRWATLRKLGRFGVQGEAGNILQLMNYRLDQYILRAFVGLAGVGIYAVGVSMTEAVWLLANSVAIVLLPTLTSADADEARRVAPIATRNTLLVATAGALALAVAAPIILPAFFGRDFDGSVSALWWLLPGTVALTGSKVLTSYIFSQGKPLVNTMITVASLVVTVGALFALVPPFGVDGAAAASSLAYIAHFTVALYAYSRISGQPALGALVPQPADWRLYFDAAHSVIARIRRTGRGAADAAAPGAAHPPARGG